MTEWECQSVCIDCTWNAQDVDPGRQIRRVSRAQIPITSRKRGESERFCSQENHRFRDFPGTVPQSNTGGVVE